MEESCFGFVALLNNAYLMCINNHVSGEIRSAINRCCQTVVKCSSFTCGNSLGWCSAASTACVNNTAASSIGFHSQAVEAQLLFPYAHVCLCRALLGESFPVSSLYLVCLQGPGALALLM